MHHDMNSLTFTLRRTHTRIHTETQKDMPTQTCTERHTDIHMKEKEKTFKHFESYNLKSISRIS